MEIIKNTYCSLPKAATPIHRSLLNPLILEQIEYAKCDVYHIWVYGQSVYSYSKFEQSYTRFDVD